MELVAKLLTLERTPERRAAFLARHPDLEVETAVGIDGTLLDTDDRQALVDAGLVEPGLDWTAGHLGCALSHRELWLECRDRDRPTWILEDDVFLAPGAAASLARLLEGLDPWDLVLGGYNLDSCLDVEILSGLRLRSSFSVAYPGTEEIESFLATPVERRAHRLHYAFGLCSYAVSPAGADLLLRTSFPLRSVPVDIPALGRRMRTFSLDGLANLTYAQCSAWAVVPPLALSPNDPATSTTRARGAPDRAPRG